MPHRERYLFVCTNRRADDDPKGSCASKGSDEVLKQLKAKMKERGLAGRVRACGATCLDMCEVGIAVAVEPAHVVYRVRLEDVDEIVEAESKDELVDHLVVAK